jgi:hypothetical protein
MSTKRIFNLFLARRANYGVTHWSHMRGGWNVTMNGESYNAVTLFSSFDFYEKRYHLADRVPTLVICIVHDTVLPVAVLSLKAGNFAKPFELPASIEDIEAQRKTKIGSRVLLGMYLSGMRAGQTIVNDLRPTTRKRYMARAREYGKRLPGMPVGHVAKKKPVARKPVAKKKAAEKKEAK